MKNYSRDDYTIDGDKTFSDFLNEDMEKTLDRFEEEGYEQIILDNKNKKEDEEEFERLLSYFKKPVEFEQIDGEKVDKYEPKTRLKMRYITKDFKVRMAGGIVFMAKAKNGYYIMYFNFITRMKISVQLNNVNSIFIAEIKKAVKISEDEKKRNFDLLLKDYKTEEDMISHLKEEKTRNFKYLKGFTVRDVKKYFKQMNNPDGDKKKVKRVKKVKKVDSDEDDDEY